MRKYRVILAVVALVIAMLLVVFILDVHYNNLHADYHNRYVADSAKIENRIYTMWNIISDKYSIKEDYFEEFREIAIIHRDAFSRDGAVAHWIHTNFQQLDASVYREVMASVESERLAMENAQNNILNVCKFHNALVPKRGSCWFVADKTPLAWNVISSPETEEIMKTRRDERTIESLRK